MIMIRDLNVSSLSPDAPCQYVAYKDHLLKTNIFICSLYGCHNIFLIVLNLHDKIHSSTGLDIGLHPTIIFVVIIIVWKL